MQEKPKGKKGRRKVVHRWSLNGNGNNFFRETDGNRGVKSSYLWGGVEKNGKSLRKNRASKPRGGGKGGEGANGRGEGKRTTQLLDLKKKKESKQMKGAGTSREGMGTKKLQINEGREGPFQEGIKRKGGVGGLKRGKVTAGRKQ